MHEAELKRNEESVQKSSAKITELEKPLEIAPHAKTWGNLLPDLSSHFEDARSALDEFCDAHRQALKSVKTQDSEVRQQNEKRADELRVKHEGLDEKEEKLREREESLMEREEKLREGMKKLREGVKKLRDREAW